MKNVFATPNSLLGISELYTPIKAQLMDAMPPQFYETAGLLGVVLYLGSYAALQLGLIRGNSRTYTLLNLAAASFVLISLLTEFNLASAMIQISWIVISITGLTRMWLLHRRLRFSDEERELLQTQFPDLSLSSARSFLDAGNWLDLPEGYELLHEETPVSNLFYLASGDVDVASGSQHLAVVSGGFLGEINILPGTPASATVTAMTPLRVFSISRNALRRLRQSDSDFRIALDSSLNKDTGRKLVAANARLVARSEKTPA